MDYQNKKIDESWKKAVEQEKKSYQQEAQEECKSPEPNFSVFITTLGLQASISLGDVPNPLTQKKEINLDQAKYLIDVLDILKEKTTGNLTDEEKNLLENLIYDLKMRYATKARGG